VLRKHGIDRALVAAGGEIVAGEAPPGAAGWTVGIAPLEDPDARPARALLLRNAAVSTSGDAEQHVVIDGKRYSHIVDPKTGLGLTVRSSATVLAPNGTTADALATAVSVLGPEKGLWLIEETDGVSAYIIVKTERGQEEFVSKRFPKP
jgi:thiamine biosynthesis lipoprotein